MQEAVICLNRTGTREGSFLEEAGQLERIIRKVQHLADMNLKNDEFLHKIKRRIINFEPFYLQDIDPMVGKLLTFIENLFDLNIEQFTICKGKKQKCYLLNLNQIFVQACAQLRHLPEPQKQRKIVLNKIQPILYLLTILFQRAEEKRQIRIKIKKIMNPTFIKQLLNIEFCYLSCNLEAILGRVLQKIATTKRIGQLSGKIEKFILLHLAKINHQQTISIFIALLRQLRSSNQIQSCSALAAKKLVVVWKTHFKEYWTVFIADYIFRYLKGCDEGETSKIYSIELFEKLTDLELNLQFSEFHQAINESILRIFMKNHLFQEEAIRNICQLCLSSLEHNKYAVRILNLLVIYLKGSNLMQLMQSNVGPNIDQYFARNTVDIDSQSAWMLLDTLRITCSKVGNPFLFEIFTNRLKNRPQLSQMIKSQQLIMEKQKSHQIPSEKL